MLKIFAAMTGSVCGFVAGIFLAIKAGLHERPHVFAVAAVCGAVLCAIFMLGAGRLAARATAWRALALNGIALIACVFALVLFWRMIY